MECEPTESADVVKLPEPATRGAVPRVVVPSTKVTEPVGVPREELTIAVKVTATPKPTGFAEATGGLGTRPRGVVQAAVRVPEPELVVVRKRNLGLAVVVEVSNGKVGRLISPSNGDDPRPGAALGPIRLQHMHDNRPGGQD